VDIEASHLEDTAGKLKKAGAEFDCYQGDVSRTEDTAR